MGFSLPINSGGNRLSQLYLGLYEETEINIILLEKEFALESLFYMAIVDIDRS